MRLTSEQIKIIKHCLYDVYGENACVYLFGSRVNDTEKGGDIDLLIEVDTKGFATFENEFKLAGALQRALGPQKIDLISYVKGQPTNAIQQQALLTGVQL